MSSRSLLLGLLLTGVSIVPSVKADTMSLYNWGFNVDGNITDKGNTSGALPGSSPAAFFTSGFNFSEGLGTITIWVGNWLQPGSHNVEVYFDNDLRPVLFGQDYSNTSGSLASGESYEVGAASNGGGSLLWTDFMAGAYSNTNNAQQPDDVAVGLGFSFTTTAANPLGIITLNISTTAPSSGFYIHQYNTIGGTTPTDIYISGSEVNGLPEPSSWLLFALPLGLFIWKFGRKLAVSKSAVALGLFAVLALVGTTGVASANPIVKTVPWVPSNPILPHYTIPNQIITLKGTTDQTAGTYTWSFGDGSSNATGSVTSSNNYQLEATHTYSGSAGQIWTATLTVTNGTSTTTSYYVEMQASSQAMQVNLAIDEGLWYLHKTMTRNTCGSPAVICGAWTSGYAGSGYGGNTAQNTNAFEVSGHLQNGPSSDPYTETVTRGFNQSLNRLTVTTIPALNAGSPAICSSTGSASCAGYGTGCTVNNGAGSYNVCLTATLPGGDSNYYAIYENDGNGEPIYQTGMFMDMLVSSGTPTATAATGPAGVTGRQLQFIVQDMMDYYFYCQWTTNTNGGGWHYQCRDTTSDNSPCQWAAIGILAGARTWGLTVPNDVILANETWLLYDQQPSTGEFGYTAAGSYAWTQYATTPSGLVQLSMDGIGRGNSISGRPIWDQTENYMRVNFTNSPCSPGCSINNYYYGLFSFTKSMHLHAPGGVPTPITYLQATITAGYAPIDWYGDPTYGVAQRLVSTQSPVVANQTSANWGGYWTNHDYTSTQYTFETAESIIMLQATVVSLLPVAVATATPNPQLPNQAISFSGASSYDQQPGASIVSWQWDFTGGTNFTASGVNVSNTWTSVGTYNVRLRVTDNQTPTAQTADTIISITIEPPVAPPTSNPGGPYSFCPETTPWKLSGAGSIDPQAGQSTTGTPSAILSYGWAINGDNNYADATGVNPDVTALLNSYIPGSAGSGNTINVSLKVTDNDLAAYNIPNESSISSTQVTVHNAADNVCSACTITLNGRVKPKIGSNAAETSLWWSPVAGATYYNVYRSTTSGGPYTYIGLGSAAGSFIAFLDTTLNTTGTYYYTVQPFNGSGSLCTSNQVTETVVQQVHHQ